MSRSKSYAPFAKLFFCVTHRPPSVEAASFVHGPDATGRVTRWSMGHDRVGCPRGNGSRFVLGWAGQDFQHVLLTQRPTHVNLREFTKGQPSYPFDLSARFNGCELSDPFVAHCRGDQARAIMFSLVRKRKGLRVK